MDNNIIWQTKLAARVHDPAEKALVLLRDPAGHEGGTSKALTRLLGLSDITVDGLDSDNTDTLSVILFKKGLPVEMYRHVQRADWWAAGADRPQWPMEEITVSTKKGEQKTFKVANWAQVRWTNNPVLIHPLTGDKFDLGTYGGLGNTDIRDIKQRSIEHFSSLLVTLNRTDPTEDPRKTLLTYWRFGPDLAEENDNGKLGMLWKLLPADTRIPDHSIWDHLDLTSAFAGSFAADPKGDVALLALSIGPVQSFIASARTTSDLWSGSHLLSRLAWEAMKPVCEALGPDAILFPRLRGVPQVDLWLRDEMDLPDELFKDCSWAKGSTDANPLFSAALPNRFVAVVPTSQAQEIAAKVTQAIRAWLQDQGRDVVMLLLKEAGFDLEATATPYEQMREQLDGFPEVHWAVVPFSLIRSKNMVKQNDLDVSLLSQAMAPFFGVEDGQYSGFLDQPAWKILAKEFEWSDNTTFFSPNPGVLYPAIYDLVERVLAAAKSTRPFAQIEQKGWRCSLTGETEWLTTDKKQLELPAGQRQETLWTKISVAQPAWAKKGEHLGALPALKRLWPTLFAEKVRIALENKDIGRRFVVSTQTMALAHQIDQWLEHGVCDSAEFKQAIDKATPVALPQRLIKKHFKNPLLDDAKRIPSLLEAARDSDDESTYSQMKSLIEKTLSNSKEDPEQLENYYALLMLDGDCMGAWLSGGNEYGISYRESFHPQVAKGFDERAKQQKNIKEYGDQKRALSPNRHLAISGALNDFSLTVVRHVIEEEHLGRVIYAGGDDVLAMLPVPDLLSSMQRLRMAYSGDGADQKNVDVNERNKLFLKNGFALLNGKLMRMMGTRATASCGAVIAHHQAPLTAVLRELRRSEARAKNEGGRNAFSLTLIKRSGGTLYLTAKWGEPIVLLRELRNFLADPIVSRRAVYHSLEWLADLPEPTGDGLMLKELLAYQLNRQSDNKKAELSRELAQRLTEQTLCKSNSVPPLDWLKNFMMVAEFLARETRTRGVV